VVVGGFKVIEDERVNPELPSTLGASSSLSWSPALLIALLMVMNA